MVAKTLHLSQGHVTASAVAWNIYHEVEPVVRIDRVEQLLDQGI